MTLAINFPQFPLSTSTVNHPGHGTPQPKRMYPGAFIAEMRRGSIIFTATFSKGRGECDKPVHVEFDFPITTDEKGDYSLVLDQARVEVNRHEDIGDIDDIARESARNIPVDSSTSQRIEDLDITPRGEISETTSTRLLPEMVDGLVRHFHYIQNHTIVGLNPTETHLHDILVKQNPSELRDRMHALALKVSDLSRGNDVSGLAALQLRPPVEALVPQA
ncbi:MAG TPA: hypothetical protein PKB15_05145 [Acidimicrobiia bacterium]|nr:hypothetical protein [Acidimicrobiia bacterium]